MAVRLRREARRGRGVTASPTPRAPAQWSSVRPVRSYLRMCTCACVLAHVYLRMCTCDATVVSYLFRLLRYDNMREDKIELY